MSNKIIILGLDGATWTKFDEYIKAGFMPKFSEILKNGTKGVLNSNFPFTSGTAWTTIFTGANPGKHGIPHHEIGGKQELPSIWEILSDKKFESIVINDLITYPPKKINGIMISGGFSTPSNSENFAYPKKIHDEIISVIGEYYPSLNKNALKDAQNGNLQKFFEQVEQYGDNVTKLGIHLIKKYQWQICSMMLENPDYVHHFFWDKPEYLQKFYSWLDEKINEIYTLAKDNDANLFVVSDHGFGPIKKHFLINSWLEQMRFTELGKPGKIRKALSKTNVKRDFVRKNLSRLKIRKVASKLTPQSIKGMIPIEEQEHGFILKNTKIFSEAYNEISIRVNDSKEYEKLRENVISDLLNAKDEEGKKIVLKALKREDVFQGPFVNRAYDIQILLNEGYCWSPSVREKFIQTPDEFGKLRTGDHRPEGVFFAVGPDIKSDFSIKKSIYTWDFLPTILHLLSQNIPNYVDGSVIEEIFSPDSEVQKRNITIENISEKEFIKKRIAELRNKLTF